jgi:hypothetical protein
VGGKWHQAGFATGGRNLTFGAGDSCSENAARRLKSDRIQSALAYAKRNLRTILSVEQLALISTLMVKRSR